MLALKLSLYIISRILFTKVHYMAKDSTSEHFQSVFYSYLVTFWAKIIPKNPVPRSFLFRGAFFIDFEMKRQREFFGLRPAHLKMTGLPRILWELRSCFLRRAKAAQKPKNSRSLSHRHAILHRFLPSNNQVSFPSKIRGYYHKKLWFVG